MDLWKSKEKKAPVQSVKETKNTCNACGKVWHYGKQEVREQKMNAIHNAGKAMSCCGGCMPALLIKDKQVVDLKKCPSCGSKNIKTEEVSYEVNK